MTLLKDKSYKAALTSEDLFLELKNLGVKSGMNLLVLCGESFVDEIIGGSHTIVDVLLKCVGEEGTIVMEAFNRANSEPSFWDNPQIDYHLMQQIRDFTPASNVYFDDVDCDVVDNLRKRQGVIYSKHPRYSYIAKGKYARVICNGRKLDYSFADSSPLARLYELRGSVLFMGQPSEKTSVFYLAQHRSGKFSTILQGAKVKGHPKDYWRKYFDLDYDNQKVEPIVQLLKQNNAVKQRQIGSKEVCLIAYRMATDVATTYYKSIM